VDKVRGAAPSTAAVKSALPAAGAAAGVAFLAWAIRHARRK
jgi:hypothetical protein